MKVSRDWLTQLVKDLDVKEVMKLLPHRTIGTKEVTSEFIELDMKGYNRADLLSMRGVAYEIAAISKSEVSFQEETKFVWENADLAKLSVEIEDQSLCPVYCLAKIEGLAVEKTKSASQIRHLVDSGMRPVNNIADITNLVMLEYGQPLHAFDCNKVFEETIVVRKTRTGETLLTLDSKNRQLNEEELVIADPKSILGLAGVMGGKVSEVGDSTKTILLEAAIFDPKKIRRTAQTHKLFSEASKRFQHGLTVKNLLQALNIAIKMYQDLGGKLTALTLIGDFKEKPKTIILKKLKCESLIGLSLTSKQIEESLKRLNFKLESIDQNTWKVEIPYYRLDIELEEDLIEEVARLLGYENIKPQALKGEIPQKIDQSLFEKIQQVKHTLADIGLSEIQTYSFYSAAVLETMGFNETTLKSLVKIANPISSETQFLRLDLWPNLTEAASFNLKRGSRNLAIFELGKVYLPSKNTLPKEEYRLSILVSNGKESPGLELIQIIKNLGQALGENYSFKLSPVPKEVKDLFHPTRFSLVEDGKKEVADVAEVHPRVLHKLGIEQRVAVFEINL